MDRTITKQYVFEDADKYEFPASFVEFHENKLRLLMQEATNNYEQDYSNPANFVYDSSKVEFVAGKIQQKDQRPSGATFLANYTSSINGSWGSGVLTGTAYGGATVGSGRLDLRGGAKGVDYPALGNVSSAVQTGCVRLTFIPAYSGAPSTSRVIFCIRAASGNANMIQLLHTNGGRLYLYMYNSSGVAIMGPVNFGSWNPSAGIPYEFELNWDLTAGANRLFINGVVFGFRPETGTRSSSVSLFRIGVREDGLLFTDGQFDNIFVFPTVQHVTDYTPGAVVPDYAFFASNVTLPEMEHVGAGELLVAAEFATEDFGNPGYTIQIDRSGSFLYWDDEWTASDGSPAQSTIESTFNDHVTALPVSGAQYGQFKIHFSNGDTQQWVDVLQIALYESTGYPTTPQRIVPEDRVQVGKLISFFETATKPAGTEVKYGIEIEGIEKYWNGSEVVTADGTAEQANTAAEANAHILSFLDIKSYVRPIIYLITEDEAETPELESVSIRYEEAESFRQQLNQVLIFIGAATLSDEEFALMTESSSVFTVAVYNELKIILDARNLVGGEQARLASYYTAKGVEISTPEVASSNIYIGGAL